MIFATYWFIVFAAVFFPLFGCVRAPGRRLVVLLAACFCFQWHFAGPAGMWPILGLAALTYLAGLSDRRWHRWAAITVVVAALAFYKYSHFLAIEVIGPVSPGFGSWVDRHALAWLPAAPPLAISFFSFEFVHYLYDRSQGAPAMRHPGKFAAFAFFFPSLVAGPIKRYQPFLASLETSADRIQASEIQAGILRVAVGFFKKIVIADNLTVAIGFWQPRFADLSLGGRWLVFFAIAARILADFSGYSDIAIGLARMAGIELPENFNWPYLATNLQDFWRRWHMSLSFWIRDYVYIPLGGNRRGIPRKILNGLIAFGLIGLWHGAAWHFIGWGIYHGAGLAISSNYRACGAVGRGCGAAFDRLPPVAWALTLLFVCIGWVYFFYPIGEGTRMLRLLIAANV